MFAAIAIGLLQDPLRKMVPGVPGYLSMTSLPDWMAVVGSALFRGDVRIRPFLSSFPRFSRWIAVFGGYLLIPAALAVISLAIGARDVQVKEKRAAPKITGQRRTSP